MREQQPMPQTIEVSEARARFSELVNKVYRREIRILVEESGMPVAAIVSVEDLERLRQLDARREELFSALDVIGEKFQDVPEEEIEREVTRALAEARARGRYEQVPSRSA